MLRDASTTIIVVNSSLSYRYILLLGCVCSAGHVSIHKLCIILQYCLRSVQVNKWTETNVSRRGLYRKSQKTLLGSSSSHCQVCY